MQDSSVENAILDGEIVAFDEEGRPSFSLMQQRTGMTSPGDAQSAQPRACQSFITRLTCSTSTAIT